MSTDPIAELRAALDAEEASARVLAEPHDWRAGPGADPTWEDESTVYMWPPEFHTPYEEDKHWRGLTTSSPELAVHIARHDPAFVLADIAAKRKLLDLYEAAAEESDDYEHGQHAASLLSAIETLAEAYGITTEEENTGG
jgi:hypothetical protein